MEFKNSDFTFTEKREVTNFRNLQSQQGEDRGKQQSTTSTVTQEIISTYLHNNIYSNARKQELLLHFKQTL